MTSTKFKSFAAFDIALIVASLFFELAKVIYIGFLVGSILVPWFLKPNRVIFSNVFEFWILPSIQALLFSIVIFTINLHATLSAKSSTIINSRSSLVIVCFRTILIFPRFN